MNFLGSLYLSIGLFSIVQSGNVVIFQLVGTGSYTKLADAIVETLSKSHQVTYFSITHKQYNHPNVTLKSVKDPILKTYTTTELQEQVFKIGSFQVSEETLRCLTKEFIEDILTQNIFQDLIKTKPKFDAIITYSTLSEYTFRLAHVLKAPLIQIVPSLPLPWNNDAIGNPNFISTDLSLLTGENSEYFMNRLLKFVQHFLAITRYNWYYMPKLNTFTNNFYPPETPSIEEINKNTSLLIVNTHPAMGYSRPNLQNYIEIGGIHCKPFKPLSSDLEEFISGSGEHGVIYLSFGSTIRSKFPEKIRRLLINVFEKLPQRILWKWNEDMNDLPENVKTSQWFPQQDILGHNRTKLFITQGGILSLQETIYHGVPVLAIPIAFDQYTNALLVDKLAYGMSLPFTEISEDKLLHSIKEILINPQYAKKAKDLSILMKDRQRNPSDDLSWWIDYIIRHQGFPLYKPEFKPYSWMRRIDVDILGFFIITSIVLFVLLLVLMSFIVKLLRKKIHLKLKVL